jgi:hypothetical protein
VRPGGRDNTAFGVKSMEQPLKEIAETMDQYRRPHTAPIGRAPPHLRLQHDGVRDPRDRGDRLPRLGPSQFVSGQSAYASLVFSVLSYLVAIP